MQSVFQDLRLAWRMALSNLGFTLIAVITLGLGLGAVTAVFSAYDGVMLDPLPYPNDRQLAWIWPTVYHSGNIRQSGLSPLDYLDYRERTKAFSNLSVFYPNFATLKGSGAPERLPYSNVSGDFFNTMGVAPLLGRALNLQDEVPLEPQVVVLSYATWQRRYGGDPAIVGKSADIENNQFTIVGVMPRGFDYPTGSAFWTPESFNNPLLKNRSGHFLSMIGRVKPGYTLAQAESDLQADNLYLRQTYPDSNRDQGIKVVSLVEQMSGPARIGLDILLGAAGLVLLIACANVANLLLARAAGRRREIALRSSLGARRSRIARQLLTESLCLAALGGLVGIGIAALAAHQLPLLERLNIPRLTQAHLNLRVLFFCALATLLTGVLFGLAPILHLAHGTLASAMKEGQSGAGSGGRQRIHGMLVATEIAIALVLLIGTGLLIRSLQQINRVDPGFQPDHRLVFSIAIPSMTFQDVTNAVPLFQKIQQNLQNLPGVQSVGMISQMPLSGERLQVRFDFPDKPLPRISRPDAGHRRVLGNYFQTMGIPLIEGRYFNENDNPHSPPVIVISESLARTFFAHEDPIGRRLELYVPTAQTFQIVGVVGSVHNDSLTSPVTTEIYLPFLQSPIETMTVVMQNGPQPWSLASAATNAIHALSPDMPLFEMHSLNEVVVGSTLQARFRTGLLGALAALALFLAGAGIYGVISYSVAQRGREIALRMALGADSGQVLGMVVRQALTLGLVGVMAGVLGALALTRFLGTLLFKVPTYDPLTYVALSLGLLVVTALAAYGPARRATRVDPNLLLRCE